MLLPDVPLLSVEQIAERSELLILAVPDDELPGLVTYLASSGSITAGQILVHTSGRHGTEVLAPATALGAIGLAIHPAVTFTGMSVDLQRLNGTCFAVTGPAAHPIAQALVVEMGGEPRCTLPRPTERSPRSLSARREPPRDHPGSVPADARPSVRTGTLHGAARSSRRGIMRSPAVRVLSPARGTRETQAP